MRKILTMFAAFLFAAGMMADPVALPAVLNVSNVGFRSENMPDFVLSEGDYAGTYFDMGAHDSSNDTLLYAEWDVTIQPIKYNLAVVVYNTNGWRVQLYLLNQAGDTVKDLRYKGSSGQSGQFSIGSLDLSDLAAGTYKVRARAATAWSAMKLREVSFEADYRGVSVALPGTLQPAYAELSSGASVANGAIAFAPSTANTEYATWNVSFAEAGNYKVTVDMTASNGHTYGVALLSADGATSIGSVAEAQAWDTGVKELGVIAVPAAGNYKVKLTNATQWSEAVMNSITFAPYIPEYYLVGTMNNWTEAAAYKFAVNPENAAEYMLNVTLAAGDSLKVKSGNTWYPDNAANYGVDAAHAGEKTVYFRPDGQGGNDWYYGVIYIAPNAEPQPEPAGPYYSYVFATSSGNSAYDTEYEVTSNGMTWKIMGNLTVAGAARFGGKNLNGVDRPMYTTQAMAEAIDSVIIRHCGVSSASLIVNSIKLEVASDAAFTDILETVTLTPTIGKNDTNTVKFTLANAAANSYYRIKYNLSNSNTSKNYAFCVNQIDFYKKAAAPEPPVEVNYYLKNRWEAEGDNWTWKEMTKDGETYKLENVVFGGDGVNYNTAAENDGAVWVELAKFLGDTIAAKDTVTLVLNPADSTITATLIGKYVEPVTGCDWANLPFLGSAVPAYANQFKLCKEGEQPGVVNIQESFGTEAGIYVTFPSAAFGTISMAEGTYAIQGAGMLLYVSAFTAKETEVTVVCDNNPIVFTVYNENGTVPVPEVHYYMKNNWDAAADWTWKEMTKDGDNYKLENVVFGGTGVNYNTAAENEGAVWVELAKIAGDTIAAKDTVSFVLNPADSTVTATLIGKYVPEPVAVAKDFEIDLRGGQLGDNCEKYLVVGDSTNAFFDAAPAEYNAYFKAQSFNGNTHGYVLLTALVPVEAGDYKVTLGKCQYANSEPYTMAYVMNAALTDTLTSCKQNTTQAEEGGVCYHQDTEHNVATMEFTVAEAQIVKIICAHYTPYIKFENVTPEPAHTYTVAGGSDAVFGQTWKPALEANDMTLAEGDSLYRFEKTEVTLAAGNIEFKVCEDHAWTHAWPAQNYSLAIAEAGIYTIKITFNPATQAVAAEAIKTGEAVVIPTVAMHGNFTGSWKDTELFTLASDSLSASLKINLAAGNYEFGMRIGGSGNWTANGANITRENPSTSLAEGSGNMHVLVDQAGEYTFTYTFASQTLAVAYPKLIPHYNVAEAIAAAAVDSTLAKNDELYVRGIVTKIEFKGKNFAKYGSVCVYVADATGAAGEFEYYNCYALDADTFKTSSPAYDATSTAWAQFLSVTDGNGNTLTVGDTVVAFGKYDYYKNTSTHQLQQGCYLTEVKKGPAKWENPIQAVKFFFNDDSWTPDTLSTATWDAVNQKVIVNNIPAKNGEWRGQLWLKLPMDVRAGYEYDLAFTIKANKSFNGTTVKYQENAEMHYNPMGLNLTADSAIVYEVKNMRGLDNGNGVLCISFNFVPDSTLIEMYNMSIIEHESTAPLANFYVTGNDAFTVDAGKTTAESWHPDAFPSYGDTLTVALKAGAEYQLKVCVDGSWNTVKGYNDLTEKTPGIIDADGNNHNIGFSLVEDGNVMIIYTAEVFKVVGNFVTQDIDNIYDAEKAVKVLRDGQIFILRGDKVYTVMGQPVK